MHRNNGFSTFGWENDLRFSYNFGFQGRIYLKVEITFFEKNQNIDFQGRICLKVETRIFTKVDQIFDRPARGSKEPPRGPEELPRGSDELPKTSSGHQFYIFKLPINRRAAVTSTLPCPPIQSFRRPYYRW